MFMAKRAVRYKCSKCGAVSVIRVGRCPRCGEFDSYEPIMDDVEQSVGTKIRTGSNHKTTSRIWTVDDLSSEHVSTLPTGVTELDRLLGGGLHGGQVVLIGAEPGFGKSTLCLEALGRMAENGVTALYASGEESAAQIGDRARRIGATSDNLKIVGTTIVEDVISHAKSIGAGVVCVDSLQAMASDSVDGGVGGVSQSKEAAFAFRSFAKTHDVPFILVSQFTKDDDVAGSNQIPHVVDTILVGDTDKDTPLKFLRSRKNRYGRTGVTGVFVHKEDGLRSVDDPSRYLMGDLDSGLPGAARTIVSDGGRLLPVEIDALVAPAAYGSPQRRFDGLSAQRALTRVARLMVSRTDLELGSSDVFISTANGMKVVDPAADLAMMAAVSSAALDQSSSGKTMWIGEVSLTGQIRGRSMLNEKVAEGVRLGFDRVVCPASAAESIRPSLVRRIRIEGVSMVEDIVHLLV